MNRKLVVLGCAFAIIVVVVWAGCSEYLVQQNIVISKPLERVAMQFTQTQNWRHWHPVVRRQTGDVTYQSISKKQKQIRLPDSVIYRIQIINPATILIEKSTNGNISNYSLSASPYRDGNHTLVTYEERITGFEKIRRLFSQRYQDESNLLEHLKAFTEDEKRSYGFFIQTVPVFDTLILTTSVRTNTDSAVKAITVLYKRLVEYCKQNSLTPKNYYYTSAVILSNNEMQVSVGVPLPKQGGKVNPEFEFLKLPPNGHLIAGTYEGRYKDKQQLYDAMNQYIQDKHMKKVAQPLEQYGAANIAFTDTSIVSMRLYYPVF